MPETPRPFLATCARLVEFCGMFIQGLGSIVNLAVKIRPNKAPKLPSQRHKDLSALFVEALCAGTNTKLAELSNILDFLTTVTLDDDIERATWFFALCIKTLLASAEEAEVQLGEETLLTILERVTCSVKTTRCRACRLLSAILQETNGSVEVDEGLMDSIRSALIGRLDDVDAQVRMDAIAGLEGLAVEDTSGASKEVSSALFKLARCDKNAKVRAAAMSVLQINKALVELLVEKARDMSIYVQAVSYNLLAVKVSPELLTPEQRVTVVEDGINHTSEPVFRMASKMIQSWYTDWAGSDPLHFLTLFDVPRQEQCLQRLVRHLLDNIARPSDSESALAKGCSLRDKHILDEVWAFFFRIVCCWIQTKWLKGLETKDVEEEEGITILKELQDKYLPPADELLESIRLHMNAGALFQCRQLIEVAAFCISMSDAAHKRMTELVLKELFLFEGNKVWFEKVVLLAKATWTDCDSYLLNCLTDMLDQAKEIGFSFLECTRLCEVLRVVPRGLQVPYGLKHIVDEAFNQLPELVTSDEAPLELASTALEVLSLLQVVFGLQSQAINTQINVLKNEEEDLKFIALQGLADAAMTYGVVKMDNVMLPQSPPGGIIGLVLQLISLGLPTDDEDSEDEDSRELETMAVKTLCQLVYTNQSWKKLQFNRGIEAKCISKLMTIYCASGTSHSQEANQIINTFMNKFATKSIESQLSLLAAFLPMVYMCMEMDDIRCTCKAVNLMTSLLLCPVPHDGKTTIVTKGHSTLACLLLKEYAQGINKSADKKLLSTLWKAVSTLDLKQSTENEARIFASLVEHWTAQGYLERSKAEDLKLGVGDLINSVDPLSDEEMEYVLSQLEAHVSRVLSKGADTPFDINLMIPELPIPSVVNEYE